MRWWQIRDRILDNIPWDRLWPEAQRIVAELEAGEGPGAEKMDKAIRALSQRVDEWLDWQELGLPWAIAVYMEKHDGKVIQEALRATLEVALHVVRTQVDAKVDALDDTSEPPDAPKVEAYEDMTKRELLKLPLAERLGLTRKLAKDEIITALRAAE